MRGLLCGLIRGVIYIKPMDNMTNFTEDRPEFKGFNKFYGKTISPYLQERELDRLARVGKGKKAGGIITGVGLVLATHFFTGLIIYLCRH